MFSSCNLESFITSHFNQGVNHFVLLANNDNRIPPLSGQRNYADFWLTNKDWEWLEHIKDALRVSIFVHTSSYNVAHYSHCVTAYISSLGAFKCSTDVLE